MSCVKKVLSVGCVTTDLILSPVEALPPPGVLKKVDHLEVHIGGCASNAAIDLARLGIPSSLCCKIGDDMFGHFILQTAEKNGVNTVPVVISRDVVTTVSTVTVNREGERSFLYHPGSTAALRAEEVPETAIAEADIVFVAGALLLSGFDGAPCGALLQKARAMGKFTVMDTAYDFDEVWLPKIREAIPQLDLFMPSEIEAKNLTGESDPARMADKLFALGARSVIIKLGDKGALIAPDRDHVFFSPSFKVDAVDTTGAGDSFCAGFLSGLARGKSYEESARIANAVGAFCVQKIGATTGIPSMAEIEAFLQDHPA